MGANMKRLATFTTMALLAAALIACGGDTTDGGGSGSGAPGGGGSASPTANIPTDPAGMTRPQLETKIEEIEALVEAQMETMRKIGEESGGGMPDSATAQKIAAASARMRELSGLLQKYETALDALDD